MRITNTEQKASLFFLTSIFWGERMTKCFVILNQQKNVLNFYLKFGFKRNAKQIFFFLRGGIKILGFKLVGYFLGGGGRKV